MAFVTLDNVYKRYHMGEITINAADGMTFDIQKGEFAIIVGPSGSGKTHRAEHARRHGHLR